MAHWAWDRLKNLGGGLLPGAPPLAIDFGSGALKVLQLSPGEPATIAAAAALLTPEHLAADANQRLVWQIEQLPGLLRAAAITGKRAVCALPSSLTFCKHIQVVPEPGIDLNELVRADLASQLGCAPDSIVARHMEVGAVAGGKVEVVALAVAAGLVRKLMEGARAARLELVGVHPECSAILRSFDHITRRVGDTETVSLYLDMGFSATRMFVAHGTRLVFAKTLPVGGLFMDQAIAAQAKCDVPIARMHRRAALQAIRPVQPSVPAGVIDTRPGATHPATPAPIPDGAHGEGFAVLAAGMAQAAASRPRPLNAAPEVAAGVAIESNRRSIAAPVGHAVVQAVRAPLVGYVDGKRFDLGEALDALTDEIAMCLRYHDGLFPGKKIARAIFVGGEARNVGLCQHIARILRLPAQIADPLARLGRAPLPTPSSPGGARVNLSEPQPAWAVAYGLTLCPTDL
ncbi:MAG: hypothetical protein ACKVS8_07840 [Phycisphaerales bacterium]